MWLACSIPVVFSCQQRPGNCKQIMNGIKIKKETRGAKKTTNCHDVYKSDGY